MVDTKRETQLGQYQENQSTSMPQSKRKRTCKSKSKSESESMGNAARSVRSRWACSSAIFSLTSLDRSCASSAATCAWKTSASSELSAFGGAMS